jgi:hypothetical protein
MKNNQFNKLRESDRTYDYAEATSKNEKKFIKKRSHKRSRQQIKKLNNTDVNDINREELMEEYYCD